MGIMTDELGIVMHLGEGGSGCLNEKIRHYKIDHRC